MVLNCTLVDIDSMFYTSVQGTYFYQVIFGTNFNFQRTKAPLGSTIHTEGHQYYRVKALWSILNENIKLMIVSLHLINVTTVQEFNEMVVTSTGSILPDLRDFFFYLNHSRHVIFSVHRYMN